ncbi:hypothetical protein ACPCG0_10610 [Propionibacteriaceae bacterium Y1923]
MTDQTISRRTVAKGVAWAVPAVMVAGAAPAYALSPQLSGSIGSACKYPGSSVGGCDMAFRIGSTWTNTGTTTLSVTFSAVVQSTNLTQIGVVIDGVAYPAGSSPTVLITPGTHTIEVYSADTNSGNRSGTLTVTASYVFNGVTYTPKAEMTSAANFPPCNVTTYPCPF